MDPIKINPTGGAISVKIKFQSQHVISYAYRIFNTEETEILQKETGDSNENTNLNERNLKEPADFYLGKKIRISLDLIDPIGSGNTYKITVFLMQDGNVCEDPIIITGTSTDNDLYLVRWRQFIS